MVKIKISLLLEYFFQVQEIHFRKDIDQMAPVQGTATKAIRKHEEEE